MSTAKLNITLAIVAAALAVAALLSWFEILPREAANFGVPASRTTFATGTLILLCAAGLMHAWPGFANASTAARRMRIGLLSVVLLCSLTLLARYALDVFEPGQIFGPSLGRVALATALGLALAATAGLASWTDRQALADTAAAAGLVVCGTTLLGYAFDAREFSGLNIFSTMAVPTALMEALLCCAALTLAPGRGIARLIEGGGHAGVVFRTLMPAALLLLPLTGWLVLRFAEWLAVPTPFAFALLTTTLMLMLGAVVLWTTRYLERSERTRARLQAVAESSNDAILGKTFDGIITDWNAAAQRVFGYSASEAIGRHLSLVVPRHLLGDESWLMGRVRGGEVVGNHETVRQRKDGSRFPASVTLSPIRLVSGEIAGISSIVRDITETKEREAELRRSNGDLQQFAHAASHDLQEPLRTVTAFLGLLQKRYDGQLDERARSYIGHANDAAARMQTLIRDLLAYSRLQTQAKPLRPVDLRTLLDGVLVLLSAKIEEDGAQIDIGPMPAVLGDESQLGQLFQNLILNAIKFRSAAPPHIRIDAAREDEHWHITVADNGIGLDMAAADRIFDLFERLHTRDEYEGSGVGLAMAKRVVERHGGRIWVESRPGAGATFHATLKPAHPLSQQAAAPATAASVPS